MVLDSSVHISKYSEIIPIPNNTNMLTPEKHIIIYELKQSNTVLNFTDMILCVYN